MATGEIERGRVRSGVDVQIVGASSDTIVKVAGVDVGKRRADEAVAGMNVGLLLPGTTAVERGHVLATPGSIGAHQSFAAQIMILPENQGGSEVLTGDQLDFYIRAGLVQGVVRLPEGMDSLQPTHMAPVTVTLGRAVAVEDGQHFAFRRRGRAAGAGTVTQLPRA